MQEQEHKYYFWFLETVSLLCRVLSFYLWWKYVFIFSILRKYFLLPRSVAGCTGSREKRPTKSVDWCTDLTDKKHVGLIFCSDSADVLRPRLAPAPTVTRIRRLGLRFQKKKRLKDKKKRCECEKMFTCGFTEIRS